MLKNDFDLDPRDAEFRDIVAQIQANRIKSPMMPNDLKAGLRNRLLAQYDTHPQSDRLIRISIGLAAALLLIGLALWLISPRPVSAAEIVSRATLASTNLEAFGLKSYSGIKINWYQVSASSASTVHLMPQWQDRIWFQAPNLSRDEMYSYPNLRSSPELPEYLPSQPAFPDPSAPSTQSAVLVNDGSTFWWYSDFPSSMPYVEMHTFPIAPVQTTQELPTDFKSLINNLGQDNNAVTLLGTDTVGGRQAYVLSFTPKPDVPTWGDTAQIKAWIDKETYFQLGQEYISAEGIILYKWLYTQFEPNPTLSADLFTFKPPDGVQVIDMRTPVNETELTQAWQSVAQAADYKVFRPVNMPSEFIMERPQYGSPSYSSNETSQNFYLDGQSLAAFVLLENSADSYASGTPIQIGSYTGDYYEGYGRRNIVFQRDGTWIFLQANIRDMTKDELLHIAETLIPVPKP